MPILHVRNVPEDLYKRIKQQAAAQNRSLSAQVITLLERAVEGTSRSQDEILEGIRRRRFFRPADAGAPESATLLREDRAR
jgi:plasmid stability protein